MSKMLKITLPWTNYNGPMGHFTFQNSVALVEGVERGSRGCAMLDLTLPGIKYEEVQVPDEPEEIEEVEAPAPKPAPKGKPKPLPMKPKPFKAPPVPEAEPEPVEEGTNDGEDPGDMVASDRLPPTQNLAPSEAEVAAAKKALKGTKHKVEGGVIIAPRTPARKIA